MRKWIGLLLLAVSVSATARQISSPNGKISLQQKNDGFVIFYQKQQVLEVECKGVKTSALQTVAKWGKMTKQRRVKVDYQMLAGKRLHCSNVANEYACDFLDPTGKKQRLVWRLFNDGVAFRYELEGLANEKIQEEQTAYRIPEGTKRWIQRWTDAYEGFFPLTTSGEEKNRRWGYPALLEPQQGVFALISEADIDRRQSASCLYNDQQPDVYRVAPAENEVALSGEWHTPWRVAIIGQLSDVVESTLVTDLSQPCRIEDVSWIHPGTVSWIYWAYNHGSNDYNIICKYVDMAVTLQLPYVLIDAEWDEMKDGKTIEDAVAYARQKGIKPMIWYNSSVGWVNGAPGPKYRLNKLEDREREFAWCERLGVAGVKVDFFSGDNQMNMDYCIELMECAARHHLLINFHGATIPRGWQRTYPNLLTTEAVYGAEWYNNVPTFTRKAAAHNATLPFTRNIIGPMDYTPCTFSDSQHPHITSNAHELALTVLYESGLQHLADKPESYLAQPAEVQQFLSTLPVAWDETRFVAGYPGEFVVMARRSGHTWWVAGINGSDEPRTIPVDLGFIRGQQQAKAFLDGTQPGQAWNISSISALPHSVECLPRGGFVWVIGK